MSKKNNGNHSYFGGEKSMKCRRCNTKFLVKIGSKNNGYARRVRCPKCGTENFFTINEKK